MPEPTQKQVLQEILGEVQEVKTRQKTMERKLDNIEIELGGTEREPGRGVIPRLQQVEKCVGVIKKKQYKIFTWAMVVAVGINVLWVGIKSFVEFVRG